MKYTFKTKEAYKDFFNKTIEFVKYAPICKTCNVHYGNFSSFINGRCDYISMEKLQIILDEVNKILSGYLNIINK